MSCELVPPGDSRQWTCTCTYTRVSWRRFTGVASCYQTALDMYLHTCFGELAQHPTALRPTENRLRRVSVKLVRRLLALPPVDTRPQSCTCTHTRASLLTAYRHCPLSTRSHGCACIPGQADASSPVLLPVDKQPWTCTWTHASVSWRSLYRRYVLLSIGSDRCRASWCSTNRRCLLLRNGRGCAPLLHPLSTSHKCCMHTRASWHSTYQRHLEHAGNQGRSLWPPTQIVQPASCG